MVESLGEYAMCPDDFRMISPESWRREPCAGDIAAAALLTFP